MSDQIDGGDLVPAEDDDSQIPLFPEAFFEIETARIDATNRRTDLGLEAIKAGEASDKRVYDYHMARLQVEASDKEAKRLLAVRVFTWGGVFSAGVLLLFLAISAQEWRQRVSRL